jgi:hypothetical protein
MSTQKPALDLSDLTLTSIQVVPADSLDPAADGHGMTELGASCGVTCSCSQAYMPDESDEA